MHRTFMRVLAACFLLLLTGDKVFAERRVALVIGNSTYKNAPELSNPRNDAADMVAVLKSLGLTVIEGFDLDKSGMDRTIRAFATALSGADVGVFFYAGHGLQVNGTNYIVPVDAQLMTAASLEFEMVRLDLVQRIMEGEAKTNILFLDACRNNPLARNLARAMGTRSAAVGRGLAAAESGIGTLISYSTQPGNVALDGNGRNSPYTGPLVKALANPGEDIISVLTSVRNDVLAATGDKQIPWENHALRSRFYFKIASTTPTVAPTAQLPAASAPRSANVSAADAERAWAASKDTNDQLVLESFLRRYGDSFYGDLAKSRLSEVNRTFANANKDGNRRLVDANRAIELDPRSSTAYRLRGNAYFDLKDYDRAIIDFNAAVELDPQSALAIGFRGDTHRTKGNLDQAIIDYDKSIAINAKSVWFISGRGIAYTRRGDFDLAIADFTTAANMAPKDKNVYSLRGDAYLGKNDSDRAIADYSMAIDLKLESQFVFNGRGAAYLRKQDYERALADINKAIELDPKFALAYSNRGWVYEHTKEIDKAVADYTKAQEIDANNSWARDGLKRLVKKP